MEEEFAEEFIPSTTGTSNCEDGPTSGKPSYRYDYIVKSNTGDNDYPLGACEPWLHYNAKFDEIEVQHIHDVLTINGFDTSTWKAFDIKHPVKPNYRLRHICLEGPEGGVYFRGRLKGSTIIDIPDYWTNLVDPESISVSLTQIGYSQDLIVEKIEWGKKIIIKSGAGSNIDCFYIVHGSRIDGEPLIVEYEGQSPADYPGDNRQYSVSGYS